MIPGGRPGRAKICEDEAVALDDLAADPGDGRVEHRAVMGEGVKLAAFAAGIDRRRE